MLLIAAAFAQDAAPLDPPLPITGTPAAMEVTAYALVRPDPTLLTTDARFHRCRVRVEWTEAALGVTPESCAEGLADAAAAAVRQWTFAPVGAPQKTTLYVDLVLHYDPSVATLNTTAEIDPGLKASLDGVRGAPGLVMVHPAAPKKPITARLPKEARALGPSRCTLQVALDVRAKVTGATPTQCDPALVDAATTAVTKAKWTPRIVEGKNEADSVAVVVELPK